MCGRNHATILLLGLLLSTPALAQLYKWVDERGVTHYSETPPGAGKKTETLNVTPAAAQPSDAASKMQEQERAFRQRLLERQQAEKAREEQQAKEQAKAVQRKVACANAHSDLQNLNSRRLVYTVNEKGERVVIEDHERPAMIKALEKEIEEHCSK